MRVHTIDATLERETACHWIRLVLIRLVLIRLVLIRLVLIRLVLIGVQHE